jgi:hypothetical protein
VSKQTILVYNGSLVLTGQKDGAPSLQIGGQDVTSDALLRLTGYNELHASDGQKQVPGRWRLVLEEMPRR